MPGIPYIDYKKHQGSTVKGLRLMPNDKDNPDRAGWDHHLLYDLDSKGRPVPNKVNPRPYGSKA